MRFRVTKRVQTKKFLTYISVTAKQFTSQ
jgi:hypothetical protein